MGKKGLVGKKGIGMGTKKNMAHRMNRRKNQNWPNEGIGQLGLKDSGVSNAGKKRRGK